MLFPRGHKPSGRIVNFAKALKPKHLFFLCLVSQSNVADEQTVLLFFSDKPLQPKKMKPVIDLRSDDEFHLLEMNQKAYSGSLCVD